MRKVIAIGALVMTTAGCGLWGGTLDFTSGGTVCGAAAEADTLHLYGISVVGLDSDAARVDRVDLPDAENIEVSKVRIIPQEGTHSSIGYATGWPPKEADGVNWQAGSDAPDGMVKAGVEYRMVLGLKQVDAAQNSALKRARVHYEVEGKMRYSDVNAPLTIAVDGCEGLGSEPGDD